MNEVKRIVAEVRGFWQEEDGQFLFAIREYDPATKLPKWEIVNRYRTSKDASLGIYPDMLDDIYWFTLKWNGRRKAFEIIDFSFEADSLEEW